MPPSIPLGLPGAGGAGHNFSGWWVPNVQILSIVVHPWLLYVLVAEGGAFFEYQADMNRFSRERDGITVGTGVHSELEYPWLCLE